MPLLYPSGWKAWGSNRNCARQMKGWRKRMKRKPFLVAKCCLLFLSLVGCGEKPLTGISVQAAENTPSYVEKGSIVQQQITTGSLYTQDTKIAVGKFEWARYPHGVPSLSRSGAWIWNWNRNQRGGMDRGSGCFLGSTGNKLRKGFCHEQFYF